MKWWRRWFDRRRLDQELQAELQFHYDQERADAAWSGASEPDLHREVARRFGGPAQIAELCHDARGTRWFDDMLRDVRASLHSLSRERAFVATVVGPVALAIAGTTTAVSVVYHVLLQPLPFPNADRLVTVSESRLGDPPAPDWASTLITGATYEAWEATAERLRAIAVYGTTYQTLAVAPEPMRLQTARVSANFFDVLGVKPLLGRFFRADEDRPSATPVVVLSERMWRDHFAAAPGIVGQAVTVDGRSHVVIGIAPRGFHFPDLGEWETELWNSHAAGRSPTDVNWRDWSIALLAPGATAAQAGAEATRVAQRVHRTDDTESAPQGRERTVVAVPMVQAVTSRVRLPLLLIMGAAGLLLLVASLNAAGLLSARAQRRQRELALRAALGATAGRVARALIADAVLLAGAAAVLGGTCSVWIHLGMPTWLPGDFPRLREIRLDWVTVLAAAALSLLAMVTASLGSIRAAWRVNLLELLQRGGAGRSTPVSHGQSVRIVAGVAISCVLLISAAMLTHSLLVLLSVEKGFTTNGVLTAQVSFPASMKVADRRRLSTDLLERLSAVGGVEAAGLTNALPLESVTTVFTLEGETPDRPVQADFRVVSPGYFDALGIRLVEGRYLNPHDTRDAPPVVIVNRAFVQRYGSQVRFPADEVGRRWTIVGVVDDVLDSGPDHPAQPAIYRAFAQDGRLFFGRIDLAIRTTAAPATFASALRSTVRQTHPQLALYQVHTLDAQFRGATAQPRLYAGLMLGFAVTVLAVVGTGLYGLLSFAVSARAKEFALRRALGAPGGTLIMTVTRRTVWLSLIGVALGITAGVAVSAPLSDLVFGLSAHDPLSFAVAPLVVGAVVIAACSVPAYRAATTDLCETLRAE